MSALARLRSRRVVPQRSSGELDAMAAAGAVVAAALRAVQAAAIAGTSTGAMKVRAHRGYEALRKLLGKRGSP